MAIKKGTSPNKVELDMIIWIIENTKSDMCFHPCISISVIVFVFVSIFNFSFGFDFKSLYFLLSAGFIKLQ